MIKKTGVYLLALAGAGIILAFVGQNLFVVSPVGGTIASDVSLQLLTAGRIAALLGAYVLLLQLLLIGRVRWIEQVFGLDRLSRAHHYNGLAVLVLLMLHPVLVTFGYSLRDDVPFFEQELDFLRNWEDVLSAAIGLSLLIIIGILSIGFIRRRFRYELWYGIHLPLYIAVALAIGHQFEVGSDLTLNNYFRFYWYFLYGFVAVNLLWYRLLRPILHALRHDFRVDRIEAEAEDVTSVYITGRNLARFRRRPGQFLIVRFLARGFWREAHPFSLSCPAEANYLRLSIKRLGDFTGKIPRLVPGTRVIIEGPNGVFTPGRCKREKVLLIAGGIGITPLRAMADELLQQDRDVTLLYGNRKQNGIVFERELAALSEKGLRVVHILSDEPDYPGEKGVLTQEAIARLVPDVADREVFLCGPPKMMQGILKSLHALNVPRRHVYYERFAL
ncbi:MAG TPA: ferredoxin reductase family protein [Candidatus Hydrogenedentes bacterium]|nr:ferredoxin reductase family protein [Candidatus Hydrogenedentota bacterium]